MDQLLGFLLLSNFVLFIFNHRKRFNKVIFSFKAGFGFALKKQLDPVIRIKNTAGSGSERNEGGSTALLLLPRHIQFFLPDENLIVVVNARHLYPALGNALDAGVAAADGGEHVGGLETGGGGPHQQQPAAQQAHRQGHRHQHHSVPRPIPKYLY